VALAVTPGGNGTVPQAQINTLANILAACVNSDGAGPACTTLFTNATADGTTMGTQPTDTATAAINIAHNSGTAVAALYGLVSVTPPFSGGLTAQPNDFTVGLSFAGGPAAAEAIAIDDSGNVWMPDFASNKVVKLSSSGTILSGSGFGIGGMNEPGSIAIDLSGNVWISEFGAQVVELSESGAQVASYSGTGGLADGWEVAIDGSGNAWIANGNAYNVVELSGSGSVLSGSGFAGAGLSYPGALAFNGSGHTWVINYLGTSVAKFSSSDSNMSGVNGYTGGGLSNTVAIAVDGGGNAWITNELGSASTLTKLSGSGGVLSGTTGYSGGGMNGPRSIAIDGRGNVWVANPSVSSGPPFFSSTSATVTEFSNAGAILSGTAGYQVVGGSPLAIAVDGSGKGRSLSPDNIESLTWLASALAGKGDRKRALELVRQIQASEERTEPAILIASVYARLGMATNMFEWLERAVAVKSTPIYAGIICYEFTPYFKDPRYHSFLDSIGLSHLKSI
jgi:streptogramin lyase